MTRRHIPLKKQLAAALCQMLRPTADGKWERIISSEHARAMTPDQVISLFHLDHYPIAKALDGPDEHWNLIHRPILEHRGKTRATDVPVIAKVRRIAPEHKAFRQRLLAKAGQGQAAEASAPPAKIKSRPMPFGRQSRLKKTMSGKVVER